jgi:Holliday junction resolvasome RuvABC ATP-dependent DNA helicase subunit
MGKVTFAHAIAQEMGVGAQYCAGVRKKLDLIGVLTGVQRNEIAIMEEPAGFPIEVQRLLAEVVANQTMTIEIGARSTMKPPGSSPDTAKEVLAKWRPF